MLASVIQIGNSRGIRLAKRIFHELKIKDEVELIINKDTLIIKGVKKDRGRAGTRLLQKGLKIKRTNYYFLKILTMKLLSGFGTAWLIYLII